MDRVHRLNEAEIASALSGQAAEQRIAECESCAAEFAEWKELGNGLRRDLESQADLPAYFWRRQEARIRARLSSRPAWWRGVAAAICALVLLAFGLIQQSGGPRSEVRQTAAPQVVQADPDEALLQDIQASLAREVPAPLAPAAVLVEEIASASHQAQQVKEN